MKNPEQLQHKLTGILLALGASILFVACSSSSEEDTSNNNSSGTTVSGYNACLTGKAQDVNTKLGVRGTAAFKARVMKGGALYDKWWEALGTSAPAAISVDNPLWDTRLTNQNTNTGPDTWRCKECHGWDYKGKDGAYGSGSHYTGFSGLISATGYPAINVFCAITSGTSAEPSHQFSTGNTSGVFTEEAALDLTAFITSRDSNGLINTDAFINPLDNSIIDGVASTGEGVYSATGAGGCGSTQCHRADGTFNAGDHTPPDGNGIGEAAVENPYEVLHKVRFGDPGSIMPPLNLTETQLKNVLAYVQSLDSGSGGTTPPPIADVDKMIMGGLYYDNWPAQKGVTPSPATNPTWDERLSTVNTATGADTWRCKECHGWDYNGASGAYRSGSSHYTGIPGLIHIATNPIETEADVINIITNGFTGKSGSTVHNYGLQLDANEIAALAHFIKNGGVVDTSPYIFMYTNISPPLGIGLGDATLGADLYTINYAKPNANCEGCHGTYGCTIDFDPTVGEFLGDVAQENPWELLHTARFGHPASIMPGMIEWGLTLEDASNVLAHTQKLNALNPSVTGCGP